MGDLIFNLALKMEERTELAVDVQHIIGAVVMGSQTGEINREEPLELANEKLLQSIEKYVRVLFTSFEGKVGEDD